MNWTPTRLPRAASLALLLLSGTALPALALDGDDFASKLNAAYTAQGGELKFSAIETDGSDIILKQSQFVAPGHPAMDVGDLTFENVSETGDGGYAVGQVSIADIDTTEDGTRVQVTGIEVTGLKIPADPTVKGIDSILFYDGFSSGPVTVSKNNIDVFKLASTDVDVTEMAGDKGFGFTLAVNGIAVDVKGIDDPKAQKTLSDLGYEKLNGSLEMDATWELESGRLHVPQYALTLDDIGRLNIAVDVSGYTKEFIKTMGEAQKAGDEKQGMMMMGLMQQLTFTSAEISFDDASLTARLLEYAGKQQGVTGEQMAQAAKGMLPLVVGQLGIPALQSQLIAAANVYLENPKNLSVTAKPANPVPFPQIMGAGMGDPRQLVDLLNVQITANE